MAERPFGSEATHSRGVLIEEMWIDWNRREKKITFSSLVLVLKVSFSKFCRNFSGIRSIQEIGVVNENKLYSVSFSICL